MKKALNGHVGSSSEGLTPKSPGPSHLFSGVDAADATAASSLVKDQRHHPTLWVVE